MILSDRDLLKLHGISPVQQYFCDLSFLCKICNSRNRENGVAGLPMKEITFNSVIRLESSACSSLVCFYIYDIQVWW